MAPALRHSIVDTGPVRLHCVEAGEGPLVVLLHGFPECWISWRHQIPALAAAGYHVVAPDLRGYGLSDKPEGLNAYRLEPLAADVAGLIQALGEKSARVVGHDWGGYVAWHAAMWHPERVSRLAILNIPHPQQMARGLRTLRQLRKSWYIFALQLPWLPEARIRRDGFALVRELFAKDPRRADAYSPEDVEAIVGALSQPGALTAALAYYRASVRRPTLRRWQRIDQPVLVIWGEQDTALGKELAAPDPRWVPHARVERIADASHWVQTDARERVNELLLGFLQGG